MKTINRKKLFAIICTFLFGVCFWIPSAIAQGYGLGDIPLDEQTYNAYMKTWPDQFTEAIPASYDARTYGLVTSPKNQGNCGSCWAFASVGAFESHLLKQFGGSQQDLSEQQLVSCDLSQLGCCGGSSTALQYWQSKGPIQESCGTYAEAGTSCSVAQRTKTCSSMDGCSQLTNRVTGYYTVPDDPTQMKTSLYNDGPSYWRFTVYSDFDTFWSSASSGTVYKNTTGTVLGGHAVLLIGWDDTKQAYLCKNSWGATGGPQRDGTFWIAYSGHKNNLGFQMANFKLTGTPAYQLCLTSNLWCNKYYLNVSNNNLVGYNDACGGTPYPIAGSIFGSKFAFYVDFPETSAEAGYLVFGDIATLSGMYGKFNKNGTVSSSGPITLSRCTTESSQGEAPLEQDLMPSETFSGNNLDLLGSLKAEGSEAGTICLNYSLFCDKLYMNNTYLKTLGAFFGYDDDCGDTPYAAIGFTYDNKYMIYGDYADGSSWGYLATGSMSTLSGPFYSLSLSGTEAALNFYNNVSIGFCTGQNEGVQPAKAAQETPSP